MIWALVNTIPVQLTLTTIDGVSPSQTIVKQTSTAIIGTICNLIAYDGSSSYLPLGGYKLEQVPDTAQIGDTGY